MVDYKIKQEAEDFVVEEIIKDHQERAYTESSNAHNTKRFILLVMEKKNINTIDALNILARKFKIKTKQIGFCGLKDKRAITKQYITLPYFLKKKVLGVIESNKGIILNDNSRYITLSYVKDFDEKLNSSFLLRNKFKILVYLRDKDAEIIRCGKEGKVELAVENYFDNQRFGSINLNVAIALLKQNWKEASRLLSDHYHAVRLYLRENKSDYIGAIRCLDKRLINLIIHSYQSYLFNELLKRVIVKFNKSKSLESPHEKTNFYVKESNGFVFASQSLAIEIYKRYKSLPLVGFDLEKQFNKSLCDGKVSDTETEYIKKVYRELLSKNGLDYKDFIIRSLDKMTIFSSYRNTYNQVKIKFKLMDKVKMDNEIKLLIEFELPKASYGTIVVKKFMLFYQGLRSSRL